MVGIFILWWGERAKQPLYLLGCPKSSQGLELVSWVPWHDFRCMRGRRSLKRGQSFPALWPEPPFVIERNRILCADIFFPSASSFGSWLCSDPAGILFACFGFIFIQIFLNWVNWVVCFPKTGFLAVSPLSSVKWLWDIIALLKLSWVSPDQLLDRRLAGSLCVCVKELAFIYLRGTLLLVFPSLVLNLFATNHRIIES